MRIAYILSCVFWAIINFGAIYACAEDIIKNGWARNTEIDFYMAMIVFIVSMFLPVWRVILFGTILYMACYKNPRG